MTSTFDAIVREEKFWRDVAAEHVPADARLLSCSESSPHRRVYEHEGSIYKLVSNSEPDRLYENTLEMEYRLLDSLRDSNLAPRPISYGEGAKSKVLVIEKIVGEQIGQFGDEVCKNRVSLRRVLGNVIALNRLGVRHGDITKGNLLFCGDKDAYLIDFDQAAQTSPWRAFFGDVLGMGSLRAKRSVLHFSLHVLASRHRLIREAGKFYRAVFSTSKESQQMRASEIHADEAIKPLVDIWNQSKSSDANAPGMNVSYYSLRVAGTILPGERSWEPRWGRFEDAVNFEGKRLLELGCNLSMLSCYAQMFGGARPGMAVDYDAKIVESAKKFSAAIGADVSYRVCNFDAETGWEDELLSTKSDIVSALSVMHWLTNKDRFLAFLSNFDEILYEGHESVGIEYNRLRSAGYRRVQLVDVSERGRVVLHAQKT